LGALRETAFTRFGPIRGDAQSQRFNLPGHPGASDIPRMCVREVSPGRLQKFLILETLAPQTDTALNAKACHKKQDRTRACANT